MSLSMLYWALLYWLRRRNVDKVCPFCLVLFSSLRALDPFLLLKSPRPFFFYSRTLDFLKINLLRNLFSHHMQYWPQLCPSCASLVAQLVKNLSAMQETRVWPLDQEDPLEKGMQPILVFFPGEFHGQRSLMDYSPWGPKESDTTEQLTHIHMPFMSPSFGQLNKSH